MTMAFSRILRATAGTSAIAVLLAAGVAHSTATRHLDRPAILAATAAQEAFPDADYGVDPMVTGPTSASFKIQQAQAGCDKAVWPSVPLDCYPDR
ncbi:hypothetical protein [Mesorhizobium sp. KR9-304]|uniref:hypothetical protein n=1 Tax=Mesorhizobium sp. KR9-304 TaxID=3156614 RepID=UPI0032B5A1FA